MPSNKITLSIDLLKLVGAQRMQSGKGKDILVIDLANSRVKVHKRANDKGDSLYLNLECVPNRDGQDDYGNTHFVAQPTTKTERQEGLKLPIVGNAKEWPAERQEAPPQRQQQQRREPVQEGEDWEVSDGIGGEDIPF